LFFRFGTKKPRIGLFDYFKLVVMFFCVSVCNNYAFNFNIPMPLHMIFRAGSLIANMVMGMLILNKRYRPLKIASIMMITVGIVVCTLESGKEVKATDPKDVNSSPETDYFWWVIGIVLLTVALFLSARMGIYQEVRTINFP
jgi:solute carrier family 35 (UDP-xylose/UDP-N-acetylglucosamine transporter), member B4